LRERTFIDTPRARLFSYSSPQTPTALHLTSEARADYGAMKRETLLADAQ
jgi:hypothetical protein